MALRAGLLMPPMPTAALLAAAALARPGEDMGEKYGRDWRVFRAQLSAGVSLDRVADTLGLGKWI